MSEGNIKITLPPTVISLTDKVTADGLNQLIQQGRYPSLIEFLLKKAINEPDIFTQKENQQKDISIELFNIANAISNMGREQGRLQSKLNNSLELLEELHKELKQQREQNKVMQETMKETADILSSSSEGLSILNQLESKDINLQTLSSLTATTPNLNIEKKVEEVTKAYVPVKPFISEDLDEEDDIFGDSGFSDEEMSDIFSKLRQE